MHSMLRATLGAVTVQAFVAVATVGAQSGVKATSASPAGGPTACSIIDAAELKRITGLKDYGQGPQTTDPAELPKGRSECEFLGFTFAVVSGETPQTFAKSRNNQAKGGTKVETVAGVGDDAFYWWDPDPAPGLHQVGIAIRVGSKLTTILDMTSADSIETSKRRLLTMAKTTVPRLR